MITFYYNDVDVFNGICQTPLLERQEETVWTGRSLARIDTIILSGKIKTTSCTGGFSTTYSLAQELIRRFSVNFKNFDIIDGSNIIFSHNQTIVDSVTIEESAFFNMIPFQVKLICYKDSYAELYGVLEPEERWSYEENLDKTVSITHTVSCRGLTDSADGIENARNFISAFLGYSTSRAPTPIFSESSFSVSSSPVLISKSESINRHTAGVSITETYLWDNSNRSGSASCVLLYSMETSYDDKGVSISISGSVQGAMGGSIESTRTAFATINFYTIANQEYQSLYQSAGTLPSKPISFSVNETSGVNRIEFTTVYRNESTTDPYVVDSTTVSYEGADACINVSVEIRSDVGCPAERLRKTKAYFETFDLYSYIASKWTLYGDGRRLGNTVSQKSVSFDTASGTIGTSGTICCNSTEDCGCLENLSYSINIKPAIPQMSEEPALEGEGCYAIQRLNYLNRAQISISGKCRPSKCCSEEAVKSSVYSKVHQLLNEYFPASDIVLESAQISVSYDKSDCSFSFSWNGAMEQGLSDIYFYATF